MVIYTAQGKGNQADKQIIMGVEEIPAKALAYEEHPVTEVQLFSHIHGRERCSSMLCTPLAVQTHSHYIALDDRGQYEAVTVHTVMVNLGQDWNEIVMPQTSIEGNDCQNVKLNAISAFVRGGYIYPVLETKLSFGESRSATSLVVGKYNPEQNITTIAHFPENGLVAIETEKHIHGLAIDEGFTQTYASIHKSKPTKEVLLHSLEPKTQQLASTKMLPTPLDMQRDQQLCSSTDSDQCANSFDLKVESDLTVTSKVMALLKQPNTGMPAGSRSFGKSDVKETRENVLTTIMIGAASKNSCPVIVEEGTRKVAARVVELDAKISETLKQANEMCVKLLPVIEESIKSTTAQVMADKDTVAQKPVECTLVKGDAKCAWKSVSKDNFKTHLTSSHIGSADFRKDTLCPGCEEKISNIINNNTTMEPFLLHIETCPWGASKK